LIDWNPLQSARPSPNDIESWWSRCPDANVGILTGMVSGIAVLDLDRPDAMARAEELGIPDDAPRVGTARGLHVYCLVNTPTRTRVVLSGLEVRSEGAYVVAPPSVHPSGVRYTWIRPPDDRPLPPLPAWASVQFTQTTQDRGIGWASRALRGVEEGRRATTCARLAGYLLSTGLPVSVVGEILLGWNSRNHPPLPDHEVARTVAGVARRDRQTRGEALPAIQASLHTFLTKPMAQECTHGARSTYQAICAIEWQRGLKPGDEIIVSYRQLTAHGAVSIRHVRDTLRQLARLGFIAVTLGSSSRGKAAKIRRRLL